MEQNQENSSGENPLWMIVKVIAIISIIIWGIMFFYNKRESSELGFVEPKPKKQTKRKKNGDSK